MQINILEYLKKTVKNFLQKIAIIDKEETITFKDLDIKAKKLATFIAKSNIINQPIAIYLPKCINSIVSDIAITYSGNTYMNLDVKNPIERITNICNLIQPKFVITTSKYKSKIENIADINIINLDEFDFNCKINEEVLNSISSKMIDTDPYCIINTSGSTGTPKGVVLNHRSFIDFTERSLENFDITQNETIGSLSPLVFDIYSIELCLLMARAATMVLIPDTLAAFPIEILKLLKKQNVTFLFWVPTIMVNIANIDLLSKIDLPKLKIIWFAGEVFPTRQFNYWYKKLPNTTFANLYGPIEITLDCTYYIINRDIPDNEPIPIGSAYKNTDILILDENNIPSKEGELCVRGSSLAMGYYNNPEKTASAFVQNPLNKSYPEIIYRTGDIVYINSNGDIVFKGRKDNLIKHLGYRIELDEIEHIVINTLKIVKNGCVVYNKEKKEITMFYENKTEISPAEFRKRIGTMLPKYMIPTIYYRMDLLPRNTNGKIDRLKLKTLATSASTGGGVSLSFYRFGKIISSKSINKINDLLLCAA